MGMAQVEGIRELLELQGMKVHCQKDEAQWILVRRKDIAIACNLAAEPRRIAVGGPLTVLLASESGVTASDGIQLPPESVAIVAIG